MDRHRTGRDDDASGGSTDRSRRGLSARTRIVGWLVALVAVALTANILIATRVLLARVDRRVDTELAHEVDKVRTYAAHARGPDGRPVTSVDALLDTYLVTSVPNRGETFFSLVDGRADRRSAAEPPARLDHDRAFVARVAAAARRGQPARGTWASTAGQVRYAVVPVSVHGDARIGALVVIEFVAADRNDTIATLRLLALISAAALVLAGVISWLVAGRLLAPIRLVRATADRIGESDLSERITVAGNDDVAQLARTFNRMLDRLESAFSTQRRFLDDAGHELRTPITVIRGHLEVLGDDPADRDRAMALVLDELTRMGRLVDDLVMLAKVERPDFVTPGEVDLADLTLDVADKSRALADRRWTIGAVADGVVRADRQRLTQALVQLALNAVQHTEPGQRITFGSELVDGRVRLTVTDEGRGIAEDQQDRIFERFARGREPGRSTEGSGLGLAIVASIAEAHGGGVEVRSRPGDGAAFTLVFPAVPVAPSSPDRTGDGDRPDLGDRPRPDAAPAGPAPSATPAGATSPVTPTGDPR